MSEAVNSGLSPIVAELENIYEKLVDKYFSSIQSRFRHPAAGPPVLSVASRGRKKYVNSWYVPGVWVDTVEDVLGALASESLAMPSVHKRAEIVIASEILHDPVQVAAEVLRQMLAHQYEAIRPGPGLYYVQEWERLAPRYDCEACINPAQPSRGWSLWKPKDAFKQWAKENVNFRVFELAREGTDAKPGPGSRMKKWRCGCTTIRSALRVTGVCVMCGQPWVWAETRESNPYSQSMMLENRIRKVKALIHDLREGGE